MLGNLKYGGPTSAIAFATMETDASAQRFVLVLQDGERVSLGFVQRCRWPERGGCGGEPFPSSRGTFP